MSDMSTVYDWNKGFCSHAVVGQVTNACVSINQPTSDPILKFEKKFFGIRVGTKKFE